MSSIDRLLGIMGQLRHPDEGCPWDCEQTFATVAPYTLEEAYEVDDAIRRGDLGDLRDELGDLLFQVVFHAQMAQEAGHFDFEAVVESISDKLVRRHPHVFSDSVLRSEEELARSWEQTKAAERAARAADRGGGTPGVFDGIPRALPALIRATKLQKRAVRLAGADAAAADTEAIRNAFETVESLLEVQRSGSPEDAEADRVDRSAASQMVGQLLFGVARFARLLGVDPEAALRDANTAFVDEQARGPKTPR
jgi:MazG family protein